MGGNLDDITKGNISIYHIPLTAENLPKIKQDKIKMRIISPTILLNFIYHSSKTEPIQSGQKPSPQGSN